MTITERQSIAFEAPELTGSDWLNGGPYTIRRGEGDIVLLDFWSTTCVRCLEAVPRVRAWQQLYGEVGLVTVGVHTPEYPFAEDPRHVAETARRWKIAYPVVLDNDGRLLAAYGVRTRPARMLIDRNGRVRFVQFGNAEAVEFERSLQALLREGGFRGELPSLLSTTDAAFVPAKEPSSDIGFGYLRGTVGNVEGFAPESVQHFIDPGSHLQGRAFLNGAWMNGRQSVRSVAGETGRATIRVVFDGEEVYAVMSTDGPPVRLNVRLDGGPVPSGAAGHDLTAADSTIFVSEPRAYHLLARVAPGAHALIVDAGRSEVEMFQVSVLRSADRRRYSTN